MAIRYATSQLTPHGTTLLRKLVTPDESGFDLKLDLPLGLLLFLFAVWVRLPNLLTIPIFNDETREVLSALDIARGLHFPLTNVSTYIGPLYLYLLAAAFRVFGVFPELPRLFVMVLAALTVVATFWLGKLWANRLAGVLGAALFATASTHIFVNSHIANSASIAPLFTTLTIIALTYAQKKRSTLLWVAAGFLYGLSLQTHPTVIFLAPALLLWVLLDPKNRAQLKTAPPYLAIGATALAYSPALLHNALTWGSTRTSLESVSRRTYAFGLPESITDYGDRLAMHSIAIWRTFAAEFDPLRTLGDYVQFPLILYLVLLLAALFLLLRRGNSLPLWAFLWTPILLAAVDGSSLFPYDTRYFAFLLPLGYVTLGILLDTLLRGIWSWNLSRRRVNFTLSPRLALLTRLLLSGLVIVSIVRLILYPLDVLGGVNHWFVVNNITGAGLLNITRQASAAKPPRVWLDEDLSGAEYWLCNGATTGEVLQYLLILNSVPVTPGNLETIQPAPHDWLALTPAHRNLAGKRFVIQKIAETPPASINCAPGRIVLVQIQALP